jgi:hypothetical protein
MIIEWRIMGLKFVAEMHDSIVDSRIFSTNGFCEKIQHATFLFPLDTEMRV